MMAWPISLSRCRVWAQARSAYPVPIRCAAPCCPKWPKVNGSLPSLCPNRMPVPTWRRCNAPRARMVTFTSLMAKRPGSPMAASPMSIVSSSARAEAPGTRGISAFVVYADTPGFEIVERIEVIAPHPLARIRFNNCRVPASHMIGNPGEGFKVAMRTLDVFRASVAAASLGFARRALDEAAAHAVSRPMFGGKLVDLQITQAKLGDMATGRRCGGVADLPRRVAARRPAKAHNARSGHGQDDGN